MQSDSILTTRFAPSPSGYLHIGHAYAADFVFGWARSNDAQCLLRIDDIDKTRCQAVFVQSITEDLSWLGHEWQHPVLFQSERRAAHLDALMTLVKLQLVYPCKLSRTERKNLQKKGQFISQDKEIFVSNQWQTYFDNQDISQLVDIRDQQLLSYNWRLDCNAAIRKLRTQMLRAQEPHMPTLQMEKKRESHFDIDLDRLSAYFEIEEDPILWRKDGCVSYHLSCVVDDAFQQVTHVIRGQDLQYVEPLHRSLQIFFNFRLPKNIHHPLLLDAAGKKFSKRDHAKYLRAFREEGLSPEMLRHSYGEYLRA